MHGPTRSNAHPTVGVVLCGCAVGIGPDTSALISPNAAHDAHHHRDTPGLAGPGCRRERVAAARRAGARHPLGFGRSGPMTTLRGRRPPHSNTNFAPAPTPLGTRPTDPNAARRWHSGARSRVVGSPVPRMEQVDVGTAGDASARGQGPKGGVSGCDRVEVFMGQGPSVQGPASPSPHQHHHQTTPCAIAIRAMAPQFDRSSPRVDRSSESQKILANGRLKRLTSLSHFVYWKYREREQTADPPPAGATP